MGDMGKLLELPLVQIIGWGLGAIGWIIGIVAGILQFVSFNQQKRLEGGYKNILEQAKRDWEGKYTQEQITDLGEQLKILEAQIRQEIPKQAKRAFLEDRISSITSHIDDQYHQYKLLSQQLSKYQPVKPLNPEIQEAIEGNLLGELREKKKQQSYLYLLTIGTLLIIVFSKGTFNVIELIIYQPFYFVADFLHMYPSALGLYISFTLIMFIVMAIIPVRFWQKFVLKYRTRSLALGLFLVLLWVATLTIAVFSSMTGRFLPTFWQYFVGIVSVSTLVLGTKTILAWGKIYHGKG